MLVNGDMIKCVRYYYRLELIYRQQLLWVYYNFNTFLIFYLVHFLWFLCAISKTTGPVLGLFVLIWKHFLCWIQIWQWKIWIFKFWWKSEILACRLHSTSTWRLERFNISVLVECCHMLIYCDYSYTVIQCEMECNCI